MRITRKAVVDLGTNTFHLLIVDQQENGSWSEYRRERIFVNLAENGIETIGEAARARALETIRNFGKIINEEGVSKVKAVGTAALRTAQNAPGLIEAIKNYCCIDVEVINGEQEANLIARGVLQAVPDTSGDLLIMDIGGGSVEFVQVRDGAVLQMVSYPIGVAVLYDQFHRSDPLSADDKAAIDVFLAPYLQELNGWFRGSPCRLIGASGTFEVLDAALHKQLSSSPYTSYDISHFQDIYRSVTRMSLRERLAHPDIPDERARYIVVALYLIHSVIEKLPVTSCGISKYAMKEGMVADILDRD